MPAHNKAVTYNFLVFFGFRTKQNVLAFGDNTVDLFIISLQFVLVSICI